MPNTLLSDFFYAKFGTQTPYWLFQRDSKALSLSGSSGEVDSCVELSAEQAELIFAMGGNVSCRELEVTIDNRHCKVYLVGKQIGSNSWQGLIADHGDADSVFGELTEGIAFAEQVISEVSSLIVIIDVNGNIRRFNQECERLSGLKESDVLGKDALSLFFFPEQAEIIRANLKSFFQSMSSWETLRDLKTIDGVRKVQWRNRLVRNGTVDQWFLVCSGTDVTEELLAKNKLERLASTDSLTELPNRHAIQELITQRLASCEDPFSLVFLDLDNFKKVNDHYGHLKGDLLIKQVATQIRGCLREADKVARLGGDEFLVLLEGNDATEIAIVCDRITDSLKQAFMLDTFMVYTGASMGVAVYPAHGKTWYELVRSADTAMYVAKESGKGRWDVFTSEMNSKVSEYIWLDTNLRSAVALGEMYLVFQPKIDLNSNKLAGAEALIRWTCEGRTIFPDRFIPYAEESGLIISIGRWVWQEALRASAQLDGLRIAVNLSVKQLLCSDFLDLFKEDLREAGYTRSPLDFEITESCLMDDFYPVSQVIAGLKSLGAEVHMDDFGTAYSSLSTLANTSFDVIKLDRSFIDKVPRDPRATGLVRAMVAVARELNIKVVAEGVETNEQAEFLKGIDVTYVQGYLYAKPLPLEDFKQWQADRSQLRLVPAVA